MKKILVFAVFLAIILFVAVPYVQFVIQRGALDTDLAAIMMDVQTMGTEQFAKRVDQICLKNRLKPGSYTVDVQVDKNASKVRVEIAYQHTYKLLFFPRVEDVVLTNEAKLLGL